MTSHGEMAKMRYPLRVIAKLEMKPTKIKPLAADY